MSNECIELKNIKYKSMLLSGKSEGPVETVENMSNLDKFLAGEKKHSSNEVWAKLDKTTKLLKFDEFASGYCNENNCDENDKMELNLFLNSNLDRKRLLKAKEVIYDKDTGKIKSIPSLMYNPISKKFTLKRCEKRQSTLKSLAPKKSKSKKIADNSGNIGNNDNNDNSGNNDNNDKIDINND
jgi:hypothetical protein